MEKSFWQFESETKKNRGKRYCSRECFKKHTNVIKYCEACGKGFKRWKSVGAGRRFCSVKCAGKSIQKHEMQEYKNKKYYKTTAGYYVSRPKGKHGHMIHRDIFEDFCGIKLEEHNTIHHRDGNKANNNPKNLELWTTRHPKGVRVKNISPTSSGSPSV